MAKAAKPKKSRHPPQAPQPPALSPDAQEVRALLRRIPDGFQAALQSLAAREPAARERVMTELARGGMGKEALPLVRAAALSSQPDFALTGIRLLPLFGTRAAADVLVEAYKARPEGEFAEAAWQAAQAFLARSINVAVPHPQASGAPLRFTLRETAVTMPDGSGARSVSARLQDQWGVWHAILLLWNDEVGVRDGFMRPLSRQEWQERQERNAPRGLEQVVCPPDYARWQAAYAREISARAGADPSEWLKEWDAHLGPPPEGYVPPDPAGAIQEASPGELAALLERSAELAARRDLSRWFAEPEDTLPWGRRWTDLQARLRNRRGDAYLAQEEQHLYEAAARDLYRDEMYRRYRERLVEFARVCEWRHDPEAARLAAAVVRHIDEGRPPEEQPLFLALSRQSVSMVGMLLAGGIDPRELRPGARPRYRG